MGPAARRPEPDQPPPSTGAGATVTDPHFAPAITAFTGALGDRLRPCGPGFVDLFTDDAVLEVPFDGAGDAAPVRGRAAMAGMVEALSGVLQFHQVRFHRVLVVEPTTVVCEYEALLERHDLGQRFRRRYISVLVLQDGRIAHLREHGGPFMSTAVDHLEG